MDFEWEIKRLDDRVARIEDMELRASLQNMVEWLRRHDRHLEDHDEEFEDQRKVRDTERVAAVAEKKADRRWQIATAFTTATFVLGAFALILQAFGGG